MHTLGSRYPYVPDAFLFTVVLPHFGGRILSFLQDNHNNLVRMGYNQTCTCSHLFQWVAQDDLPCLLSPYTSLIHIHIDRPPSSHPHQLDWSRRSCGGHGPPVVHVRTEKIGYQIFLDRSAHNLALCTEISIAHPRIDSVFRQVRYKTANSIYILSM